MAKSKITYHDKPKRAAKKPKSVSEKTIVTSSGERKKVVSVSANSDTFADDILYAFSRSVRAARRENQKKLGTVSGRRGA